MDAAKIPPQILGAVNGALAITYFVLLFLPYWLSVKGEKSVGAYGSVDNGSSELYKSQCTIEMSEAECGNLVAVQISSILTVLFSIFTTVLYFLPPKQLSALPFFLAVSGTIAQTAFALMTSVIFSYFQIGYFNDDGINTEYPTDIKATLGSVFYLWIVTTIISGLLGIYGVVLIRTSGYRSKGLLAVNNE